MTMRIHFRSADDPYGGSGHRRWQVEGYEDGEGTMFPVALAWVVEFGGAAQLGYIQVGDAWRRRGYATMLVHACRERWPDMTWTGPMDNRAASFIRNTLGADGSGMDDADEGRPIKVTLWHVTTEANAAAIEAGGFRDGPFRETRNLRGVYFADQPNYDGMAATHVPPGYVALVVQLEADEAREYEVREDSGVDREWAEWFVPGEIVNRGPVYRLTRETHA